MKDEILSIIQKDFPLCERPFFEISQKLGIGEEEVLQILRQAKEESIIRQTSAIFDTKKLGYKSSLVAFKVPKEQIENVANIINLHPGVSHNYEREHEYNLWFTIAVAPNSRFSLEETVQIFAQKANIKNYIILPTIKMFKISVKLDTSGKESKKEKIEKKEYKNLELNDFYYNLIALLQEDIDFVEEPFKKIVEELNISYKEFFDAIKNLQDSGHLRRFASILNHRKAGFEANAMVVWEIEKEKWEEIGKKVAEFSAVSHCYLRPTFPQWPYSLFSMIHGKTTQETQEVIEEIKKEINPISFIPLYSTREFKKVRIKYFTPEFKQWEEEIL